MENKDTARITALEITQEYQREKLRSLEQDIKETNIALKAIQAQLAQIKWLAVGACIAVIANELGIAAAIKAVM